MTSNPNIRIIELSKKKIIVLTIGSLGFVVASIWIYFSSPSGDILMQTYGLAGFIFFGLCAIYGIRRFKDKRPGLILHPDYIAENTGFRNGDVVFWKDVIKLDIAYVKRTRILLLHLKDPDSYVKKFKGWKNIIAQMNYRYYGSPFTISSATLSIDFDELTDLVSDYMVRSEQVADADPS